MQVSTHGPAGRDDIGEAVAARVAAVVAVCNRERDERRDDAAGHESNGPDETERRAGRQRLRTVTPTSPSIMSANVPGSGTGLQSP